jgi:serine/threonine-protein kinase
MEYLEGMDLARAVEVGGPLPPGRLIHVIANACDALAEAHALGLVHRDVKPANVFLCRRGGVPDFVKVLDYGIARALDAQETTATGVVAGTPDYMAPEVIRGDGIQPASDIYALGATAYEALTGWRVFGGRALRDLLLHHLQTEPIPPRKRLASVPADLEAVILRCLAKEPEDRHPDMHALAEALRACRDAGTWTPADAEGWWREHGAHAGVPRAPEGGAEGR